MVIRFAVSGIIDYSTDLSSLGLGLSPTRVPVLAKIVGLVEADANQSASRARIEMI
jgi:hypothetical protein